MTPYEVVSGRLPPSLLDYVAGTATIPTVNDLLLQRTSILQALKENLQRAQQRMHDQANTKRRDITFQINDCVYLRLRPYRQTTVAHRQNHKLARRFYGPFRILARIGPVAYHLELPSAACIHDVFHVSKLKCCHGDPPSHLIPLPSQFLNDRPLLQPAFYRASDPSELIL